MQTAHRIVNDILTGLLLIIGVYLIGAPFWPEVTYYTSKQLGSIPSVEVSPDKQRAPAPTQENMLLIPSIGVETSILEGGEKELDQGILHRSHTNTPDEVHGNTVIVGHRFQYTSGPKTFYHLDKLQPGDHIVVYWEGLTYQYVVSSVDIVSPHATEIEKTTNEPLLTLYTCTPLWTAENRLVVKAKPIYET